MLDIVFVLFNICNKLKLLEGFKGLYKYGMSSRLRYVLTRYRDTADILIALG